GESARPFFSSTSSATWYGHTAVGTRDRSANTHSVFGHARDGVRPENAQTSIFSRSFGGRSSATSPLRDATPSSRSKSGGPAASAPTRSTLGVSSKLPSHT